MTLEEHINKLPKHKQFDIAIRLLKLALPIWENYADKNELTYIDTVVGLHHSVERTLLKNTIEAVEKYISSNMITKIIFKKNTLLPLNKKLRDPIVALQEIDWKLPYDVESTFYSVYNLLDTVLGRKKSVFNETTIYITINQAMDALESSKTLTETEIREIIYDNKNDK